MTFGFIVATLYGTGFHLVVGGDVRRLAAFLLAGWVGFIAGHFAGVVLDFEIMNIGALCILPASFGAIVALVFTQALTASQTNR